MKWKSKEREQALLELLWEVKTPLSSMDIFEKLEPVMENITYVHRTIAALEKKGLIHAEGLVRRNTQYARTFTYTLSKEEYAAKIFKEMGLDSKLFGTLAMALVKGDSDEKEAREKLISELEELINELKDCEDGEE